MSRLEELRKREAKALMPGGQASVDAQHKAGKKTARERVSALLDPASFVEIDKFVRKGYVTPGREGAAETGEGVVCGYGTINGEAVFVFAQDYTVLSGSVSVAHAQKILKAIDMAASSGNPVVGILDSGGSRIAEGVAAIDSYAAILKKLNEVSGVIPTICMVAGSCVGTAAYVAAAMDLCVAIDKVTTLALHGPQIYSATLGDGFDPAQAFSASASVETGTAQFCAATEDEGIALVKTLLGYLPANNLENAPEIAATDDLNRQIAGFDDAYDPAALIAAVADSGQCLEYQKGYGKEVVTALARLNGTTVGFVANGTEAVMDGSSARKAARFISLLDAYDIPLINFVNCTGTPITVDEPSLLRDCAALVSSYAAYGAPMITVVAGQAVGDGYAMMAPKALGADLVYAWPQAVISALPPSAGALILYEDEIQKADDAIKAKQDAIEKYEQEYANAWQAAEQGVVDDIIDPASTRQMLAAGLEMCRTKRVSRLPKKHGILAL